MVSNFLQNLLGIKKLNKRLALIAQNLKQIEVHMATFADLHQALDNEMFEIKSILNEMKNRILELETNAATIAEESVREFLAEQSNAIEGLIARVSSMSDSLSETEVS